MNCINSRIIYLHYTLSFFPLFQLYSSPQSQQFASNIIQLMPQKSLSLAIYPIQFLFVLNHNQTVGT